MVAEVGVEPAKVVGMVVQSTELLEATTETEENLVREAASLSNTLEPGPD